MRDYTNFERCNGEPCCVFAERICADNYKELLEKGKDSNGEEVFGEMLDDLLYLAELIDFMGITSCLAARGTLSERLKDCDVLIFPELIEGVLVNSFVNQGILGNVAFFHGFP